jgi:RNA polymerase sigma-70 factor (ECF subfamily)
MEELVAEEKEDLGFVWEAVSQLPDNYREVIHLFYHEGFTTAEIAAILGRREVTVRSDLSRARKKLKEILKEAYDFE